MSEPLRNPSDDAVSLAALRSHGGSGRGGAADDTVSSASARLARLAERWRRRRLAAAAFLGLAVGLPLAAVPWRFAPDGVAATIAVAAVLASVGVALFVATRRPRDPLAIAAHLDRRVAALGDSAALLLAEARLPPLQRLQQRRAAVALLAHDERELARLLPWRPLRRALALLLGGVALAVLLLIVPLPAPRARVVAARSAATAPPAIPPPTSLLRSLAVSVQPPPYTGHRARRASTLGTTAEEGATVRWRVEADRSVGGAALLFDESERLPLRRQRDGSFAATVRARSPRLLRLLLHDSRGAELWRSPPARLDVTADRPPTLELLQPATTILERPADRPGSIALAAALADDYGIAGAELVVTVATGRDEQVSFAEQRRPLAVRRGALSTGGRQVVRHAVDLAALGFGAESEVYLRLEARDGRRLDPARPPEPNLVRSPSVVVRPQVERQESVPLGEGLPLLAAPELFRSQRQIVLDTQKLIAEAPRLAAAEVMRRSRAIGFDQRALRLRYGTLLGQEFEEGRPVGGDGDEHGAAGDEHAEATGPALGGVADAVPGGLSHQHDSEESATFFPDPVRRKLKAMLGAMWDAERELQTGAPRAALPHELRALDLLKQVQQADRVYVRKAGGETAPLDPARRLTGELEDVRDLDERRPPAPPRPVVEAALATIAVLERGGGAPAAATVRRRARSRFGSERSRCSRRRSRSVRAPARRRRSPRCRRSTH